ncbi:MAG: DPP IV N-terminal domain-containing protein, partial [Planctomycetes bacterium]|nr:DPP IV N-terminal domain-containing protein [Planctomycetota bacterium]
MRSAIVIIMGFALSGCAVPGHGRASIPSRRAQSNIADPHFLNQYAVTRRFSLGRPTSIKFLPDGAGVLFLRSGPRSFVQDLYEFDIKTRREKLLLTAESILLGGDERLSPEERARRERMRMTARGIASYQISDDGAKILVPLSGRLFVIHRTDGAVTELHSERGYPIDPKFSPDGRYISCVRDGELYVMELATGKERVLTDGAGDTITNGLAEFVAQEEMGRFEGYWWSPDGQTIAFQRTDTSGLETMHIMDAMHPNRKPQAWPYPRPGKPNADVRLGLVALEGGPTRWVTWDRRRYPYLATVRWEENAPLTILVQDRRQREQTLLTVDIKTGITSVLLTERDEAWLNLDPEMPLWLPDGDGFLWTTERNGVWQLERRARNGELVEPLTGTDFSYQGLADFDADSASVFVLGGPDPTQTHIYRIDLQPRPHKPVRVTQEPGMHHALFSKNHLRYVHIAETMNAERFYAVRSRDGREIGRLRSVAEKPPFVPNIELTTVGDDPAFHAVLVRPKNFDPKRRYPVIVNVYGGPHGQMVAASPNRYLLQQWIADHGFIVVSIDGR